MGALTPRPSQSPEPNRSGGKSGGLTRFSGAPDLSDVFKPASDMYAVGADKVPAALRSALQEVTPGDLIVATTSEPVVRRRKNGSTYQATIASSVTRNRFFVGELRRALASSGTSGNRMKPAGPWRPDGVTVELVDAELRSARLASRPVARAESSGAKDNLGESWRQSIETILSVLPEEVERRVLSYLGGEYEWAHEEIMRSYQNVNRTSIRYGTYTDVTVTERVVMLFSTKEKIVAVLAERSADRSRGDGSDDRALATAKWDVRLLCAKRGERREIKAGEMGETANVPKVQGGDRPKLGGS